MHPEITEKQRQAIELMALGQTSGNIAKTLDIHRQTLWRWQQSPSFAEALEAQRHCFRHECNERFQGLIAQALTVLEKELAQASMYSRESPFTMALNVLKFMQPAKASTEKP